jgi:hypothetical protein
MHLFRFVSDFRYHIGSGEKSIHRSKRVATRKQKIENRNNTLQKFKKGVFRLYTSRSDLNGRILGKQNLFRVKRKEFLTEMSALNAME